MRRLSLIIGLFMVLGCLPGMAGADQAVDVTVLENSSNRIVIDYRFDDFSQQKVLIDGAPWSALALGRESLKHETGWPALPDVSRSVIVPDDAKMAVRVLGGESYEIHDMDVAPSKGILLRSVDPAAVPHSFGKVYQENAFWPASLAELGTPYILRDQRGLVVTVNPFQYNPVTRVLRVYTSMTVEVVTDGPGAVNVMGRSGFQHKPVASFHSLYNHHFINYGHGTRYAPLDEQGDMLIICHDAWTSNIQAFADHKTSIGINATVVPVSTVGNNSSSIASYVATVYNSSDLAFVLLVGDAAEVATAIVSGGESDSYYAKIVGGDDYPDIMVGRFSAETAANVDTQVLRSIEFEDNQSVLDAWYWKGLGVASDEGAGIGDEGQADDVHMAEIRDWLLAHGLTEVGELYGYSTTPSQVASALNAGRGIVNYVGHGDDTSWSSTGFSNSDVNALTNDNKLPIIVSVACLNANFGGLTCFGEAWTRATNGSEPTGAVAIYASSVSCSWAPPMEMQDEFNLLYTDASEPYHAFGTLCYAGSCSSIDDYGSSGVAILDEYILFGDPSLKVIGTTAPPSGMSVSPGSGLISEGPNGGPFTPTSQVYTLTNNESYALNYTVSESTSWLDISSTGGTIPALGTATVTASLNASANGLADGTYTGDIDFVNTTNHDGDTSRTCQLTVGVPVLQLEWNMDTNPGWTTQGQWAWGSPTGGGGAYGNPDPTSGATGSTVYGYNLSGDYGNSMSETHLTSTAIDCSAFTQVTLKFQRYLNVETSTYDHAYVRVSNDGSSWTTLWSNSSEVTDSSWSLQEFDISSVADGEGTVYLRWTQGVTDSSWTYSGWNIDDVQIWGTGGTVTPTDTVAVSLGCTPSVITLPATVQMAATLTNLTGETRRADGRINVVTGDGTQISGWRGGYTNLSAFEVYNATWNQYLPGASTLVGTNTFTLVGADVTPAPYNQPPYLPSGDTDVDACMVVASAP